MKKKMNSKKGFTLVEIIVVLVILAIMAGFAIPAYNGFVERARQSEILAAGRVVLIAAQTAGQEKYALKGEALDVGNSENALETDKDAQALKLMIASYSDDSTGSYQVTFDTEGKVTKILYSDAKYLATYEDGEWISATDATAVTTSVIIAVTV